MTTWHFNSPEDKVTFSRWHCHDWLYMSEEPKLRPDPHLIYTKINLGYMIKIHVLLSFKYFRRKFKIYILQPWVS